MDKFEFSWDGTSVDVFGALARFELFLICRALEQSGGSRTEASKLLTCHRSTLVMKIAKYRKQGLMEGVEKRELPSEVPQELPGNEP
jgi:DNA-binding NtrC family response regulator